MVVCWSAKGGSGVSVVAAMLALAAGRTAETTLVDLDGDQPAILGVDTADRLGVRQWLDADPTVGSEALLRLASRATAGVRLIAAGAPSESGRAPSDLRSQGERLATALDERSIVDAGVVRRPRDLAAFLAGRADSSLLVIRPCYLAIRRALEVDVRIDGIVVVDEPARALDARDIESVLGAPVLVTLRWDAALARAVDAGRLVGHVPRSMRRLETLTHDLFGKVVKRAG